MEVEVGVVDGLTVPVPGLEVGARLAACDGSEWVVHAGVWQWCVCGMVVMNEWRMRCGNGMYACGVVVSNEWHARCGNGIRAVVNHRGAW